MWWFQSLSSPARPLHNSRLNTRSCSGLLRSCLPCTMNDLDSRWSWTGGAGNSPWSLSQRRLIGKPRVQLLAACADFNRPVSNGAFPAAPCGLAGATGFGAGCLHASAVSLVPKVLKPADVFRNRLRVQCQPLQAASARVSICLASPIQSQVGAALCRGSTQAPMCVLTV